MLHLNNHSNQDPLSSVSFESVTFLKEVLVSGILSGNELLVLIYYLGERRGTASGGFYLASAITTALPIYVKGAVKGFC